MKRFEDGPQAQEIQISGMLLVGGFDGLESALCVAQCDVDPCEHRWSDIACLAQTFKA